MPRLPIPVTQIGNTSGQNHGRHESKARARGFLIDAARVSGVVAIAGTGALLWTGAGIARSMYGSSIPTSASAAATVRPIACWMNQR